MSDIVISARGLGKKYLIGHQADRAGTFRDRIVEGARAFRGTLARTLRGEQLVAGDTIEEFWALRDVEFDIRRGETVGIIGRNGAGKSTLLKVLSRITEPTTGRVEIRGRVASLLEVGTGFHPELSGRENIYLNGAILGMTRAEVRRKFDEIVDFAGVARFIDTPVKRYSSGMYVRLAFAVAAHLEPEILIVDEVLAVGDAEFQKKCLGKMGEVAGQGRTVLFVSHNMAAVSRLCERGIYLAQGYVEASGGVRDVLARYFEATRPETALISEESYKNDYFSPTEFCLVDGSRLRISGISEMSKSNLTIAIRVLDSERNEILWSTNRDSDSDSSGILPKGKITFELPIPAYLGPGRFVAELVCFLHGERFVIAPETGPSLTFEIQAIDGSSSFFAEGRRGLIKPLIEWKQCLAQ